MKKRYVITGMGMLNGIGMDSGECFGNLLRGEKRFSPVNFEKYRMMDKKYYSCVDREKLMASVDRKMLKRLYYNSAYGDIAANETLRSAGLAEDSGGISREDIGVCIGSTFAGAGAAEEEYVKIIEKEEAGKQARCSAYLSISMFQCAVAGNISIQHGLKGNIYSVVNGNVSGINAVIRALKTLMSGQCKVMLAGAAESPVTPYCTLAVQSVLEEEGVDLGRSECYFPFSESNEGVVLGEGCGMICIEEAENAAKRGQPVYGEILGYDSRIGGGLRESLCGAVTRAIEMSALKKEDIDLIITYGGEKRTEAAEMEALSAIFAETAETVRLTNSKHAVGHCLGASGILDIIFGIQCARANKVFPMAGARSGFDDIFGNSYVTGAPINKKIRNFLVYAVNFTGVVSAIVIGEGKW